MSEPVPDRDENALRVVGLMSGTSVDAVDVAVCDFEPDPETGQCALALRLVGYSERPFPEGLRERVLSVLHDRRASLADLTELDFLLGDAFAGATGATLAELGIPPGSLDLIASHGQTIYHLVEPGRLRSTLQMGEPSVIAERSGLTVVSDFRTADVAAGGQGAPLTSFFDLLFFADPSRTRALQNLGGIGNVTFVPAGGALEEARAFDTGPGNALIDYAVQRLTGGAMSYDRDGAMALSGMVSTQLLEEVLSHPYFQEPPPKTTGRELFGAAFAERMLGRARELGLSREDTLATITAVTSESILRAYRDFGPERIDEVVLSGGGARNRAIVEALRRGLGARVIMHDEFGLPAGAKEAVAFALLGHEAIHGRPANVPSCTGAERPVILGKITPGRNYRTLLRRVLGGAERGKESDPWQRTRSLRLAR